MDPAFAKAMADNGGLAQLARALDLHSRGQGFDSLILHSVLRSLGKVVPVVKKIKNRAQVLKNAQRVQKIFTA